VGTARSGARASVEQEVPHHDPEGGTEDAGSVFAKAFCALEEGEESSPQWDEGDEGSRAA